MRKIHDGPVIEATIKDIGDAAGDLLQRYTDKILSTRFAHLNLFAQAFMEVMDCKVEDIVLVEETKDTTVRWYFKKKGT